MPTDLTTLRIRICACGGRRWFAQLVGDGGEVVAQTQPRPSASAARADAHQEITCRLSQQTARANR